MVHCMCFTVQGSIDYLTIEYFVLMYAKYKLCLALS